MFVLASPIVDWNAMWKICLVALAAGAGVVVFFGFMLLGLKFAQGAATGGTQSAATGGTQSAATGGTQSAATDGTQSAATDGTQSAATDGTQSVATDHTASAASDHAPSAGARLGGFTLALVCGLICAGVIAVGVYAMTKKPSSKPAKTKSALVIPAGPRVKLIASVPVSPLASATSGV
jgi:hypothetical protein